MSMRPVISPMLATTEAQVMFWSTHTKLSKKDIRHFGVEVLTGLNNNLLQLGTLLDRLGNESGLDELRAGADDCKDPLQFCRVVRMCL